MVASTTVTTPPRNLGALEEVIERGLSTFVEVGNALLEIRGRRLYHDAGFRTFEDYCKTRWDFTRQRAAQLIEAAHVAGVIGSGEGDLSSMLDNARQAEALAPLARADPEAAREVWGELAESDEPVTAARIRSTVQDRYPKYRPVPKPGQDTTRTPPKVAVVTFGQILEWRPGEMAAALPEDQIEGQIAEAQAAQRWLASYVRELTARRTESKEVSQ